MRPDSLVPRVGLDIVLAAVGRGHRLETGLSTAPMLKLFPVRVRFPADLPAHVRNFFLKLLDVGVLLFKELLKQFFLLHE